MAKKRRLVEANPAAAASGEPAAVQEEPVGEEPVVAFHSEESTVEPSQPVNEQDMEEPLHEGEPKALDLETLDPAPETAGIDEAPVSEIPSGLVDDEDDDNDDEYNPESLRNLVEPFSKDQLVEILCGAVSKYPDLWSSIRQTADLDISHRKIFVHGLGWNTNAEILTNIFRKYGEIEDCNAIVDKVTGRSKGYGFILFKHRSGARRALKEPQKKIGNRMAACQLASAGPPTTPMPPLEYTQRKIYISNVGPELDPQKIRQFFSKYGEIEEGPLGLDKATGKPRGFCLFVYKSVESAKKALEEPYKNFEGHILHCQKAIDGPKLNKPGFHMANNGVVQYTVMQQGQSAVAVQGPQLGRSDGAGSIGRVTSSVGGPGHLIAPPSVGYKHAVQPTITAVAGLNPGIGSVANAGVLGMQAAYRNQVAGGNVIAGVTGTYGASPQMQGSYSNAARNQQGLGRMGGFGTYIGQ
ncbi:Heterogeneous nuclear ribonucleoprotein 1 [Apostasia shenzhenica]|uniref:Heterogeneous nuclear ribonucleoprotein 1 n=2 Tax=Apostasia shenzhenica TaxID=1088818 RepID=A0A2I0BCT3_9ASPA|nr:Heterogeneous nuclear ribonucleoprotein 1 [Apostasia shenzhenica]